MQKVAFPISSSNAQANSFAKYTAKDWEKHAVELITKQRVDKYTMITFATFEQRELVLNWVAALRTHHYNRFAIVCLDHDALSFLVERGLKNFVTGVPEHWAKPPVVARTKLNIQLELLKRDFNLIVFEPDVVVLSAHMVHHFTYLIGWGCSAQQTSQCFTDFVFLYDGMSLNVNLGFYAARPTEIIVDLFTRAVSIETGDLQQGFNRIIAYDMRIQHDKALKGLDRQLYVSGGNFFVNAQKMDILPLLVRCDHAGDSVAAKQAALKQHNMWYL